MKTTSELTTLDPIALRKMANELKADAHALFHCNRPEAMKLFRLFQKLVAEIHRRRNPAINHQYN